MTWSHVDDLVVGGGARLTAESEQGLEPGHRGASAVEPERELVEVHLQVLGADPAVGALQSGLEVADHPVDAGQDLVRVSLDEAVRALAVVPDSPDTHGDQHRPDQPQRRRTRDSRLRESTPSFFTVLNVRIVLSMPEA